MDNGDYAIGTKYSTLGKHPKVCEVIDFLRTYNSKGELIKTCYVSKHQFMGQDVIDYAVSKTTIMRGFWYEKETETV